MDVSNASHFFYNKPVNQLSWGTKFQGSKVMDDTIECFSVMKEWEKL